MVRSYNDRHESVTKPVESVSVRSRSRQQNQTNSTYA